MAVNPFAKLSSPVAAAAVETKPVEDKKPVPANAVMVFDFETVPDESRFPRPKNDPTTSMVPNLDVAGFFTVCLTVLEIKAYLSKNKLSTEQYAALLEIEQQSAKPRKGVFEEIVTARDSAVADFDAWKKECSVNPLKARIVAFGWAIGNGEVEAMTATNDNEERAICEKFWSLVGTGRRRAGYNILGFDDTLVAIRSMLLGVTPSIKLVRKKYGNHQALDLMTLLFPNSTAQKLKEVCGCLGITPPAGEMDGSQVFDLYYSGKLGAIRDYVCSDVKVERELMWKLCEMFAE